MSDPSHGADGGEVTESTLIHLRNLGKHGIFAANTPTFETGVAVRRWRLTHLPVEERGFFVSMLLEPLRAAAHRLAAGMG